MHPWNAYLDRAGSRPKLLGPLVTVEAPGRAVRILLFGCAFSVVNVGFLTALFALYREAGAARVTMGYALVLVAGGLTALKTGRWSQHLRIGLHTGPVVAGIIGRHRFAYDLGGDTVNIASRMESHGMPDCIQVTSPVVEQASPAFAFEPVGTIDVKGKGLMQAWLLTGRRVQRVERLQQPEAPGWHPA